MDFLIAIGVGIVGKVFEYTIAPAERQVGYLIHYKRNVQNLKTQVEDLNAARQQVVHKVDEAVKQGEAIMREVKDWLLNVDKITEEAKNFLRDENLAKAKCLHGFFPNLMVHHKLSRKSTILVQEVVELYGKISFSTVSNHVRPQKVSDYEALDSRVSTVNKIMVELRNPNTNKIGVYGLGGVGKTTLVKEVHRQATEDKLFDNVIIILDVRQNPSLERIQKEITEKLGLDVVEIWTMAGRARRIYSRMVHEKSLVILDDLSESIDLMALGLPDMATCKMLLTSRNREVLFEIPTQKDFEVGLLDQAETWRLFEKIAGDVVKDPAIRTVATQVAKNCGGMPVLAVTVASALKHRNTLFAWKDALRRLKRSNWDGLTGLTEKAYLGLEWSYSQLDDKELKPLFLLCGITARENYISMEDLLRYSIGLGLLRNIDTIEEARIAVDSLVRKLIDSCLLIESDKNGLVKIHDLVRDLAISIAFRDHHIFSRAYQDELTEWPDNDFFARCTMISLPHCSNPRLPEVFKCPEAKLFHLWSSENSLEISRNFFEEMKKLRVLGLTNLCIPSLPPSLKVLKCIQTLSLCGCMLGEVALVGELTSLEVLSFSGSSVKHLPKEIGQLCRLRLLDLNNCTELDEISPNVISNLKSLEELRVKNSFNQWDAEGFIGERRNCSIKELVNLSLLTTLVIHIPNADILPAGFFSIFNMLKQCQILIGAKWKWDGVDESFNTLKLSTSSQLDQSLEMLLKIAESLYLDALGGTDTILSYHWSDFQHLKHLYVENNTEIGHIISKVPLSNLSSLVVHRCNGLRFLLSHSMARSLVQLKHLEITECQMMEVIVSTAESDEHITDGIFHKLQHLKLKGLPNLAKFCSGSYLEFPSLERLQLKKCAKLQTFNSHHLTRHIADGEPFIKEGDTKDNPDNIVQYFLFDENVRFPRLERLSINGLSKQLTSIWHNQLALGSFCALRDVKVRQCNGLISIFVPSFMERLGALQKLSLKECGLLEEIVAKEERLDIHMFVFPKVTSVTFENLPQLKSFYSGKHTSNWPSLETLVMDGCAKVEIFAIELSCFQYTSELGSLYTPLRQPFFLIQKDGTPVLTSLVFHRCDNLRFLLSSSVATSLGQLKHLQISECQVIEEITLDIENGEENPNGIFLKLEQLELNYLPNLDRFCSESYIELSSLKTLKVVECAKLKKFIFDPLNKRIAIYKEIEEGNSKDNLQSVIQHFIYDVRKVMVGNLRSLIIHRSDGLSFILSSSVARSIVEFKDGEVSEYQIMEETMLSKECDGENWNAMFSKPKTLELNDLIFAQFGGYTKFSSFDKSKIVECTKLESFFDHSSKSFAIYKDIEETDSRENLETVVHHFLFDDKVVWHSLTSLTVHRCHGISFLLSSSWTRSLVHLKHLNISECQMIEEIVLPKESGEENTDGMLSKLEHLQLKDLPNLARVCSGSYIEFPCLERLEVVACPKLETLMFDPLSKNIEMNKRVDDMDSKENTKTAVQYVLFDLKKVVVPNLASLIIQQCDGLSFLFSSSEARSCLRLNNLVITKCQILEEIVLSKEYGEENTDIFSKLENLELNDLPNLTRFCSGTYKFPSLERLQLEKCTKFQTFIFNPLSENIAIYREIKEKDAKDNETIVACFLFDEKVEFPRLKRLTINDLPKITAIWSGQLALNSFSSLKDITVQRCNSLKTILPDSIFQQLQKLTVENCGVELIVSQEERETLKLDHIVFPELMCLEFKSLPQLKRFYPRMHEFEWPLLKTLVLFDCPKVDVLGGLCTPNKQSIVLIEESSFPKLEDLTLGPKNIWYGPPTPAAIHKQAVFPGNTKVPHLRTLRLHGMEKLMHLWEENPEPAGQVFTELDILDVKFCGLGNLELSAISFQNLTSLEVTFCWRLQYLMTYSVSQCLAKLERLIVDECIGMKEIVVSDRDEDDASKYEILFSALQHLELSDLINLESFCSRNCKVRVPSLNTGILEVNSCPFKLKISTDGVLEEIVSDMQLDVQKSHSHIEEAAYTTESACSSEGHRDTEGVEADIIHETCIHSENMDHTEVLDLNQKRVVTNTMEYLQEADLGMQETLTEPRNIIANEGKQLQSEANSWSISKIDAEMRRLQEIRMTKDAEGINKEKRLADEIQNN